MARKRQDNVGPSYFTTFQVAKFLGVSPPTVVNWVNSGLLVAHRTPGGHRRMRAEDVVTFARAYNYPVPANMAAPVNNVTSMPRRVMIVDDERDFAQTVGDYLQLKGGLEVEIANSGFAAGMLMARFRPSVVLMDLMMPDMDGFEVLRMLRSDPEMRSVPVLACTAYRDSAVEERARAEGFDAYLEKPLRFDRLLEIVDAALRGAVAAAG